MSELERKWSPVLDRNLSSKNPTDRENVARLLEYQYVYSKTGADELILKLGNIGTVIKSIQLLVVVRIANESIEKHQLRNLIPVLPDTSEFRTNLVPGILFGDMWNLIDFVGVDETIIHYAEVLTYEFKQMSNNRDFSLPMAPMLKFELFENEVVFSFPTLLKVPRLGENFTAAWEGAIL